MGMTVHVDSNVAGAPWLYIRHEGCMLKKTRKVNRDENEKVFQTAILVRGFFDAFIGLGLQNSDRATDALRGGHPRAPAKGCA